MASTLLLQEHPHGQSEGRGLCGDRELRPLCKGKGAFNGGRKLGMQLFSHHGCIIFFHPL